MCIAANEVPKLNDRTVRLQYFLATDLHNKNLFQLKTEETTGK